MSPLKNGLSSFTAPPSAVAAQSLITSILGADPAVLWTLVSGLAPLALFTFGGVNIILPELHAFVVEQMRWLTNQQFYEFVGLAFAAPGPNMLFVSMIGAHVAGVAGAVLALLTLVLPTSLIVAVAARWWFTRRDSRIRSAIQTGMLPATCGVFAAATLSLFHAVITGPVGVVIFAVTCGTVLRTKVHPLWMLAIGGCVGALGFR